MKLLLSEPPAWDMASGDLLDAHWQHAIGDLPPRQLICQHRQSDKTMRTFVKWPRAKHQEMPLVQAELWHIGQSPLSGSTPKYSRGETCCTSGSPLWRCAAWQVAGSGTCCTSGALRGGRLKLATVQQVDHHPTTISLASFPGVTCHQTTRPSGDLPAGGSPAGD